MGVNLTPRWGVVLDDLDPASMDVYDSRDQAEAERRYADAILPLVRIDYTLIDPGQEVCDGDDIDVPDVARRLVQAGVRVATRT